MREYVLELKRLGREKAILNFRDKCSIQKIWTLIDTSFLEPRVKTALKRLIGKRHDELVTHI